MNPLTNMKNVTKLSEQALNSSSQSSWHDQYKDSAWVFVGGLPYDLTEGDIICIFSQYGEIVNINLIRDKGTGKSKGFCFLCYEDQRSTILSVDNFNGIKIMNRSIRVDHVSNYKIPKEGKDTDQETKQLYEEGCAPKLEPILPLKVKLEPQDLRETLADQINGDIKLPPRLPIYPIKQEPSEDSAQNIKKIKKSKKKKDKKRKSKKKRDKHSDSDSSITSEEKRSRKSKNSKKRDHSSSSNDHERKCHKSLKTNTDKKYKERRSRSRSRSKDKHERIANNSESYRKSKR